MSFSIDQNRCNPLLYLSHRIHKFTSSLLFNTSVTYLKDNNTITVNRKLSCDINELNIQEQFIAKHMTMNIHNYYSSISKVKIVELKRQIFFQLEYDVCRICVKLLKIGAKQQHTYDGGKVELPCIKINVQRAYGINVYVEM